MATKTKKRTCGECGRPSDYLGAASGTCPDCQNASVAALEKALGLAVGERGRGDEQGNEQEVA